jgi:UDP-3-O-[3-hydroxymyristoyl] N-acetylglucosamine deacetylase
MLRSAGLARGASLRSVLVFGTRGPLNPEGTRFIDEPVRHKLLDLIGDLALLGAPLQARVRARGASHALVIQTLQLAIARDVLRPAV